MEHDLVRVWKSETGKEWKSGWVGKALNSNPLMVGVVNSFPTGVNLIFSRNLKALLSVLVKNARKSDLCYLGKTRVNLLVRWIMNLQAECLASALRTPGQDLHDTLQASLHSNELVRNFQLP